MSGIARALGIQSGIDPRPLLLAFVVGLACKTGRETLSPAAAEELRRCCATICACFGAVPSPEEWAAHQQAVAACAQHAGRCQCGEERCP